MSLARTIAACVLFASLILLGQGRGWVPTPQPGPGPTPVAPSQSADAVTYVYEKDQGSPPGAVLAALDKLNRRTPPIVASTFEKDTVDGTGQVPTQYVAPLDAAVKAGLPALVVTADGVVLRTVPAPTTEEQVLGALE